METALIAQGLAAGAGRQEADLLALSLGMVRTGFTNVSPEVATLDQRIEAMTFKIMDAQAAAQLNEAAFAALSPEMQAAAAELGLFGSAISAAGASAAAAAAAASASASAARRYVAGTRAAGVIAATNVATAFTPNVGFIPDNIKMAIQQAQQLVNASGGTLGLQSTAEAILAGKTPGGVTVNVTVGEEPVEVIVETNNQRSNLTGSG